VPGVLLDEVLPLGGKIVLRKNSPHRAFIHAEIAVDARAGIDKEHLGRLESGFIFGRMNAIYGANRDMLNIKNLRIERDIFLMLARERHQIAAVGAFLELIHADAACKPPR
jgi:hypothetical protein